MRPFALPQLIVPRPADNSEFQLVLKNRDVLAELFIVSQVHVQTATSGELLIDVARALLGFRSHRSARPVW